MICDKCGIENGSDARFCSHCGTKLPEEVGQDCSSCGGHNEPDALFCSNCGTRLSSDPAAFSSSVRETPKLHSTKSHRSRFVPPVRRRGYAAAAVATFGVIIVVIVISQRSRKDSVDGRQVAVVETRLQDPVDESKAMQIAKKFDCSCGTCGDLSLDTCTCPTAVKEREFIRKSVEERESPDQIIAAVNRTYGHMKSKTNFVVPPLSNFGGSAGIGANSGEN